MAEPARKLPEEDRPHIRPKLGVIRGGGETSAPTGNLSAVPNSTEADEPLDKPKLRALEGGGETSAPTGNLAAAEKQGDAGADDTVGKGFTGGGKQKISLRARIRKRRKFIIIAATPLSGVLIFMLLLILFASALKLPDVMQHIEDYQYARVGIELERNALRITDEKLALDSASEGTAAEGATAEDPGGLFGSLKAHYQNLKDNTWGRLQQYSPSSVMETWGATKRIPKLAIQQFSTDHGITFTYKTSKLTGRKVLTEISTDYGKYTIAPAEGAGKWIPIYKQIEQSKNLKGALDSYQADTAAALEADGYGTVVRNLVSARLRKAAGGTLGGFILSKFKDPKDPNRVLDDQAALNEETLETYDAGEAGAQTPDNAVSEQVKDGEKAAEEATQEEVSNPTELTKIIENNFDNRAAAAIVNSLKSTFIKKGLGVADPLYGIATPICIIEDASIQKSEPTIDNNVNREQAIFYNLASKADEEKDGSPVSDPQGSTLSVAVQAAANQVGDISKTNPEIRAGGGTINTGDTPGAEQGAGGTYIYSLINVLGLSGGAADVANAIVDHTCPVLTSTSAAVVIGVINAAVAVTTLGTSEAAADTAGEGAANLADLTAQKFATNVVKNLLSKKIITQTTKNGVTEKIEQGLLPRAAKFIFKNSLIIGGTVGASVLANMVTANRAGSLTNGLAQGSDLVNEADAGANIAANETERAMFFGRPLLPNEVCQAHQSALAYLQSQERQKGAAARYLSPSDADSLLSRTAMALDGNLTRSLPGSFMGFVSSVFRPSTLFGPLYSMLYNKVSAATPCTNDTSDYGNLQFGWSDDEHSLIDGSESYGMLENQAVLDASGNEAAIAAKYAKCFGYKYNGGDDFDPTDDNSSMELDNTDPDGSGDHASIGDALANGWIVRDTSGDVQPGSGDCAPYMLSYNSSDPLALDTSGSSPKSNDMIFRWRLAMAYDITTDQLISEQNPVSGSEDAIGTSGDTTTDSATLAKEVLADKANITLDTTAKADVEAAANNQKVTPGPVGGTSGGSDANTTGCPQGRVPVYLNATLLQAMLNIAKNYKYEIGDIVSGHVCDTGRHPLGRAMDIFSVNGKQISGHCTDPDIYQFLQDTTDMMAKLLPHGQWVDQRPVNMPGIGSCNPAEDANRPGWVPQDVNYFYDWYDEIHVDVGVAS